MPEIATLRQLSNEANLGIEWARTLLQRAGVTPIIDGKPGRHGGALYDRSQALQVLGGPRRRRGDTFNPPQKVTLQRYRTVFDSFMRGEVWPHKREEDEPA